MNVQRVTSLATLVSRLSLLVVRQPNLGRYSQADAVPVCLLQLSLDKLAFTLVHRCEDIS